MNISQMLLTQLRPVGFTFKEPVAEPPPKRLTDQVALMHQRKQAAVIDRWKTAFYEVTQPASSVTIAKATGTDVSSASSALRRLAKQGLVEKLCVAGPQRVGMWVWVGEGPTYVPKAVDVPNKPTLVKAIQAIKTQSRNAINEARHLELVDRVRRVTGQTFTSNEVAVALGVSMSTACKMCRTLNIRRHITPAGKLYRGEGKGCVIYEWNKR